LERGYGGISSVHRQYGISINAIIRGQAELKANTMVASGHQRRQGGGRKGTLKKHPELSAMFARLLEAHIAGDPQNGVLWTDKTDKELQAMLSEEAGFPVGISIVKQLLAENGLGKRKHRKTKTMGEHTERNAQFERIAELREDYHERGQVVLSMDTKKRVGW
jgi:transposase